MSQNGVPYIKGRPGEAKSAIVRSIAKKLDMQFFDLRLAEMDETEIGSYPKERIDESTKIDYLDYIIPRWAIKANEQPTILIFEEINRAPQMILNAALKILFEREVGSNYKLNENVYMVATGNLGDEDGTFVNELDSALNNRLIHINHSLTVDEWVEAFARDNVISDIVDFLKSNPASYYSTSIDEHDNIAESYATPRSWTMLSDNIKANFGQQPLPNEYTNYVIDVGSSFVGPEISKFLTYLEDISQISMEDIIQNFNKYKNDINSMSRSRKSGLIEQLKTMDVVNFSDDRYNNLVLFLKEIHDDERTAYIKHVYDTVDIKHLTVGSDDYSMVIEKLSDVDFVEETKIIVEGKFNNTDIKEEETEEEVTDSQEA
jgi:hypothetical protein